MLPWFGKLWRTENYWETKRGGILSYTCICARILRVFGGLRVPSYYIHPQYRRSGSSLRIKKAKREMKYVVLTLFFVLAACNGPLSLLTGSGPNVAANVQAGQSNTQTLGRSSTAIQTIKNPTADTITQDSSSSGVKSDKVDSLTVNNGIPWWVMVLMILLSASLGYSLVNDVKGWFGKS